MREYRKDQPLYSIHIPKTGGQSFERILNNWFGAKKGLGDYNKRPKLAKYLKKNQFDAIKTVMGDRYFTHYENRKDPERIGINSVNLLLIEKLNFRDKPICIHGHFKKNNFNKYYGLDNQFITFLRNPLDSHISLYFYNKMLIERGAYFKEGKKIDSMPYSCLDDWLENKDSLFLQYLPLDINPGNLDEVFNKSFIHVGCVEYFQNSVDFIAEKLKKKSLKISRVNKSKRTQLPSNTSVKIFERKHKLEYLIFNKALILNS